MCMIPVIKITSAVREYLHAQRHSWALPSLMGYALAGVGLPSVPLQAGRMAVGLL